MSTKSAPYAESQAETIQDDALPSKHELFKNGFPPGSDLEAANIPKALQDSSTVVVQEQEQNFGPKTPLTTARQNLVFLGIGVTLFLSALDQTIVSTTLPAVAKEFSNFADISWVGTAFLISTTAVQPVYGSMADMFGRKRTMLFASAVFLIGSALCGASQSMIMLIIARAVQGLGGSGIITLSMILVADIVPLRERGMYQAFVSSIFAVSAVVGPLLGGAFADHVSWRWAFYINLPIGAFASVFLMYFLHMDRRKNVSLLTNLMSLDFSGIFLLVVSIVLILLGLNWGADAKYAWNSGVVLSLLIVGSALGLLFLLNEGKHAQKPIIPLRLFKSLSLVLVYLCIFLQGFIFLSLMFFLPLYFQAVHGASATQSGIGVIPFVVPQAVFAVIAGILMSRWGIYKEFIVGGFAIGLVSGGLLTIIDENTSKGVVVVIFLIEGISQGLTLTTLLLAIHAQLESKADIAPGTSLWSFLRSLGGVFGVAIGSVFVQNSLSNASASQYAQNIKAIADLPEEIRKPILAAFMRGSKQQKPNEEEIPSLSIPVTK
ncbi:hypothetical protein BGZ99_003958 [Dissophora globulifera]|uniref:Major facilitator superfamily (MFS) profile domain-containing protein n=1 Tax=Dissophora globulifera TaxID=979702 RepID=A0A9P6RLP4_9FUNG|nr:hypothetical protein BGZ99_003958 [Dissophora globulifera]